MGGQLTGQPGAPGHDLGLHGQERQLDRSAGSRLQWGKKGRATGPFLALSAGHGTFRNTAGFGPFYEPDRTRGFLRRVHRFEAGIGADAFAEVRTWFRWEDVIRAVEFIVVSRPGHQYENPYGAVVHRMESVWMDVSSSAIREQIAQGVRPADLPDQVFEYSREHRLYRRSSKH